VLLAAKSFQPILIRDGKAPAYFNILVVTSILSPGIEVPILVVKYSVVRISSLINKHLNMSNIPGNVGERLVLLTSFNFKIDSPDDSARRLR